MAASRFAFTLAHSSRWVRCALHPHIFTAAPVVFVRPMTSVNDNHPEPRLLEALCAARQQGSDLADFDPQVLTHIETCEACRAMYAEFEANNKFLLGMMATARNAAEQSKRRKATRDAPKSASGSGAATQRSASPVSRPLSDSALMALPGIPGYELLGEIHRGGQGVVFRARQTATKRDVAIKMPLAGSFVSERARIRFEREIELVAQLHHPNVVTVFDSGLTPDGRYYIVMELIEGLTLDRFLRGGEEASTQTGRRRTEFILRLFAKIADAVQHAHSKGIIHRDLKPGNIMVDQRGEPHVLDFGLARRGEWSPESSPTLVDEFQGTPAYASPEQVGGDPRAIDIRTDVYAIGVMLYRALTGQWPYAVDGSLADQIRNIKETPPQLPSRRARAIPSDLDTIVLTALAKERERRYQSAGAVAADITALLAGQPIAARPASLWYVARKSIERHRALAALAAVIVTSGVLTFSAWVSSQRAAAQSAREVAAAQTAAASLANTVLGRVGSAPGGESQRAFARNILLRSGSDLNAGMSAQAPRTAIALRAQVASMLASIGEHKQAVNQLTAASATLDGLRDATRDEQTALRIQLTQAQRDAGSFSDAADTARNALSQLTGTAEAVQLQRAAMQAQLAASLLGQRDLAAAMQLCSEQIAILAGYLPNDRHSEALTPLLDIWSRAAQLASDAPQAAAAAAALKLYISTESYNKTQAAIFVRAALTAGDSAAALTSLSDLIQAARAAASADAATYFSDASLAALLPPTSVLPPHSLSAKRSAAALRYADNILTLLADPQRSRDEMLQTAYAAVPPMRLLGCDAASFCREVVASLSAPPLGTPRERARWLTLLGNSESKHDDYAAAAAYEQARSLLAAEPPGDIKQDDELSLALLDVYERIGNITGAIAISTARVNQVNPPLSPFTSIRRLSEHAKLLDRAGRGGEALAYLEHCKWLAMRNVSSDPLIADLDGDIALTASALLASRGEIAAAIAEYIRGDAAIARLESANPMFARALMVRRARTLAATGDVEGAISLLINAVQGLGENFGALGEWPRRATEDLIMLYESSGRSEAAQPYRTLLLKVPS